MNVFSPRSFEDFLARAKGFLQRQIPPDQISWIASNQGSLFVETPPEETGIDFRLPTEYLSLARLVSLHSSGKKWDLLYRTAFSLAGGDPDLLKKLTHPLTHSLALLASQIRRDAHKAKAFVRFRCIRADGDEIYVSWHKPDHRILQLVAPFFSRRFSDMRFTVVTPDESVLWDRKTLHFGPGNPKPMTEDEDNFEDLWRVYYRSTFNPARIKIKMMKQEMPVRYWDTMPETRLIPQLIAESQTRVSEMIRQTEGSALSAADFVPSQRTYASLKEASLDCKGCPLYSQATQTVFGEGNIHAKMMLLGEQPGDAEDTAGRPFKGPSGEWLDHMLEQLGIDRTDLYVTNAVKHFKFEYSGKRRLHKSPHAREVNACKPWLLSEINLIKPKVIVTLGVTAARALIHHGFTLKHAEPAYRFEEAEIIPTWHPAAVLRAYDADARKTLSEHIAKSLRRAQNLIAGS